MMTGALVLSAAGGCGARTTGDEGRTEAVGVAEETIGAATQEADDTIMVQRRTPSDRGIAGYALVRYPPGDPNHAAVSRPIGPVPKGRSVFVKPFGK